MLKRLSAWFHKRSRRVTAAPLDAFAYQHVADFLQLTTPLGFRARYPEVVAATTNGAGPRVLVGDVRLIPAVRATLPNAFVELYATRSYVDAFVNKARFDKRAFLSADAFCPADLMAIPDSSVIDAALGIGGASLTEACFNKTWPTASVASRLRFLSTLPGLGRDPALIRMARDLDWGLEQEADRFVVRALTAVDVPVLEKRIALLPQDALAAISATLNTIFAGLIAPGWTPWDHVRQALEPCFAGYDLILWPSAGTYGDLATSAQRDMVPENLRAVYTPATSDALMTAIQARVVKHGVRLIYTSVDFTAEQAAAENTRGRIYGV